MKFAKAVIEKRGFVSDDELAAARNGDLNEGEVVETIANVVANIFTNYLNHVAKTEIDFPEIKVNAA